MQLKSAFQALAALTAARRDFSISGHAVGVESMASAFDFVAEWRGPLRPIEFPLPKPMLPSATVSFLHYAGVPAAFEITTDECIRFEFLTTAINLVHVWEDGMRDWSFPVGWGRLWRIGDISFTQANPWMCIEELTGRVVAVDVDIDDPVYLVNTSVERMMRCMKIVRDWVRSTGGLMTCAAILQDALARDPALPAGEAQHFWQPLFADAIDAGCDKVVVELE